MKPNQMKTFIAVAEEGSIHRGARRLGISQPAVSTTIRQLEIHFGVPLMSRGVGGIELTEFGTLLLARGRALLSDMGRLYDEMSHLAEGQTGSVTVALSTATSAALLPPALKKFRDVLPSVDVMLKESSFSAAISALTEGSVDFAIMHVLPEFECPEGIDQVFLSKMPFIVGMRASHPLRNSKSITDLIDADWLLPPTSDGIPGTLFNAVFGRHGFSLPVCTTRCDSVGTALNLFAAMDLVGFFSKPLADVEFGRFGLIQLEFAEEFPFYHAVILKRRSMITTVVAQRFMQCFIDDAPAKD
ncbi:LysR family transcriptional regulator [Sphingobium boeckii]|uniref:DNA-binding transcriptional LysR family regulator n=1 Tax=Sphingobium boeckii TaxID=1082345 RepID=A0A7W9AFS3_9SPHN|nr:LysR family transcriptional regulator [Sphingobium boeckii]MBB5684778.1 DNA-binding transcriptional LysR family regulator [Sphingobium boeckii]